MWTDLELLNLPVVEEVTINKRLFVLIAMVNKVLEEVHHLQWDATNHRVVEGHKELHLVFLRWLLTSIRLAMTEGAVTEGAMTEGAVTEGAVTEGAVTEGAVTEGAVTEGAVTEGAVTEGAVTKGVVTEGAVTEGEWQ